MPGTMPAMNSAPIEVLVETPYKTKMIDGGTRMPSAPEVEITPTPKPARIAVIDHRGHHDRADRDHGRNTRSRYGGKHRAGRDAGKAEPARQMADQRGRERDHPPRDAATR